MLCVPFLEMALADQIELCSYNSCVFTLGIKLSYVTQDEMIR